MRLGLTFGLTLGLALCFACANAASTFAAAPEALHSKAASKPAAPHRSAQHEKPEPAKPFVPLTPAEAVQKANNYFNRTKTMIADFVQIGADGRRSEGKVFVEKPGRLRFESAAPATIDVKREIRIERAADEVGFFMFSSLSFRKLKQRKSKVLRSRHR